MTFETINFSDSIETINPVTGLKRWRKYEGTVRLSPGESEDEVAKKVTQKVDQWHKENNPQMYVDMGTVSDYFTPGNGQPAPMLNIEIGSKKDAESAIIDDINKCETIDSLKGYRLIANSRPLIYEAYSRKYESLQNIENQLLNQ